MRYNHGVPQHTPWNQFSHERSMVLSMVYTMKGATGHTVLSIPHAVQYGIYHGALHAVQPSSPKYYTMRI